MIFCRKESTIPEKSKIQPGKGIEFFFDTVA
jgi:hypothetical protein